MNRNALALELAGIQKTNIAANEIRSAEKPKFWAVAKMAVTMVAVAPLLPIFMMMFIAQAFDWAAGI